MTPDRAFHRDDREDIAGLIHRARIVLPDVILPDGTASPDQWATIPPGVIVAKALLPYRELDGPPASWTGAVLVGTREPDLAPYLPGFSTASGGAAGRQHITRPQDRDQILGWLYDLSGYRYAPAAFWKVAGWEIGWAANWLDVQYSGGPLAELSVAERQAACTTRALWSAHDQWKFGMSAPMTASGVILAARAVVDMVAALDRVVARRLADGPAPSKAETLALTTAFDTVLQRLRSAVRALNAAAGAKRVTDIHDKLGTFLKHALALVRAVGLFTAVGEDILSRVVRLTDLLARPGRPAPASPGDHAGAIAAIANDIGRVAATFDPDKVSAPSWHPDLTAGLERLHDPDATGRLAGLAKVRTNLFYKLIVTRRLDRLFESVPWMAAPCGAFPLTFGGPLGAVAALFEAGRAREVALELKRRTLAMAGGVRLDTRLGQKVYASPARTRSALQLQTLAGFLLTSSTLSHHMAKAFMAGEHFDARHPLPTLQAGGIGWSFDASMQDPATMATVGSTELAKAIYATGDYNRDLPRYMGLSIPDVLAAPLVATFPGADRDPGFAKFVALADARRQALGQGVMPSTVQDAGAANRELLRSALKSLDTPTDGSDADWRKGGIVRTDAGDDELDRFDRRRDHAGGRAADSDAVRDRASEKLRAASPSVWALRRAIDKARTWRSGVSDDASLADLLSGAKRLRGLTPVAQEFIGTLWFRPSIDRHVHDWIVGGAPMWSPLALSNVQHAGLIAKEVQAVAAAFPHLFGMPIPLPVRRRILVALWTGLAGITADHAHVR